MKRQDFLNYMGLAAGGAVVSTCVQACRASTADSAVNFTLDLNSAANAALKNPGVQPLTLIPFFRLHDSRYQLYWQQMSKAEYPGFIKKAQQQQQADNSGSVDRRR